LDADLQKPEWQYEYAGDWQMALRRMAQDTQVVLRYASRSGLTKRLSD
jgi:hypothetical protein